MPTMRPFTSEGLPLAALCNHTLSVGTWRRRRLATRCNGRDNAAAAQEIASAVDMATVAVQD